MRTGVPHPATRRSRAYTGHYRPVRSCDSPGISLQEGKKGRLAGFPFRACLSIQALSGVESRPCQCPLYSHASRPPCGINSAPWEPTRASRAQSALASERPMPRRSHPTGACCSAGMSVGRLLERGISAAALGCLRLSPAPRADYSRCHRGPACIGGGNLGSWPGALRSAYLYGYQPPLLVPPLLPFRHELR